MSDCSRQERMYFIFALLFCIFGCEKLLFISIVGFHMLRITSVLIQVSLNADRHDVLLKWQAPSLRSFFASLLIIWKMTSGNHPHQRASEAINHLQSRFPTVFHYFLPPNTSSPQCSPNRFVRAQPPIRHPEADIWPAHHAIGSDDDVEDDILQQKKKINTTLLVHFFGPKGDHELSYDEFKQWVDGSGGAGRRITRHVCSIVYTADD